MKQSLLRMGIALRIAVAFVLVGAPFRLVAYSDNGGTAGLRSNGRRVTAVQPLTSPLRSPGWTSNHAEVTEERKETRTASSRVVGRILHHNPNGLLTILGLVPHCSTVLTPIIVDQRIAATRFQ